MNQNFRRDSAFVFFLALLVFALRAIAWPLAPGRDAATYFYYVYDFGNPQPEDWFTVMFRTPLAPLFDVFLIDVLGPRIAEVIMAFLYAGSMTVLHRLALPWGRKLAGIFVGVLFLHFAYGSLFHVVSNDPPMTIAFVLLLAAALRAARAPSLPSFAILGLAAALAQATRPGIFAYVGVIALLLTGVSWMRRAQFLAVFLAALLPWILAWSFHNYRTYGVFQYSVGTEVFLPLGRLLALEQLVRKENGPASRELAELLERTALRDPKYKDWSANTFFLKVPHYGTYMGIVDRELGRGHYGLLNRVGWEAVRAHPLPYVMGVAKTFLSMMTGNLKLPVPLTNGAYVLTHKSLVAFQKNGTDASLPLAEVDPHSLTLDPQTAVNAANVGPQTLRAYQTTLRMPTRSGSIGWGAMLNGAAYLFPPISLWILAALAMGLLWWRRFGENALRALAVVWALSLLTDFAASLGMWTHIYQYRLPFDPAFVLLPIVLLLGWPGLRERARILNKDSMAGS